ncbi:MAG TPA: hypothetical protein VFE33_29375 [Thermoanaerobaculia bacterium]|nr:hypothetical protein [Thermoanaerobaculia bacterium]
MQHDGSSTSQAPNGAVILETVQWSSLVDVDEVKPVDEQDYVVLAEIRQVLAKHGSTERFGVCLLHRHFEVAPDEVAVEYTDTANRISTVRVESQGPEGNYLQTMWKFGASPESVPVTFCVRRCNNSEGHKNVHVKEERR